MTLAINMLENIFLLYTKNVNNMTLAISTLKNIFLLDTKIQDDHLKYPNVLL